ncbi:uncharacterized protein V6R79_017175 [Siganus canaliculatus]
MKKPQNNGHMTARLVGQRGVKCRSDLKPEDLKQPLTQTNSDLMELFYSLRNNGEHFTVKVRSYYSYNCKRNVFLLNVVACSNQNKTVYRHDQNYLGCKDSVDVRKPERKMCKKKTTTVQEDEELHARVSARCRVAQDQIAALQLAVSLHYVFNPVKQLYRVHGTAGFALHRLQLIHNGILDWKISKRF